MILYFWATRCYALGKEACCLGHGRDMTTEELRARKRALGYTNETIAKLSGVPLGTVQKVFAGSTKAPRYDTLRAIEDVLTARKYRQTHGGLKYNVPAVDSSTLRVEESVLATFYSTQKRPGEYTIEDYYDLPDDRRMELIEGYFYDMAAPNIVHQLILSELHVQFYNNIDACNKDCEVFFAPLDVKLFPDNKTMVQPDLVVICDREKLNNTARVEGAPELVVEVMSPSNRDHDMVLKQKVYRDAKVTEYWIVDPVDRVVSVYDLTGLKLPKTYTFEEKVPIGISGGKCFIDFSRILAKLSRLEQK